APLGVLNVGPLSWHQAFIIPDWGPTTFFLNGQDAPDEETLQRLRKRGVTLEPAPIASLEGTAPDLTGVRLADGRTIALSGLYIAPRQRITPLAEQLGCELEASPFGFIIRTDAMKLTNVPGLYAAGDLGRLQQNAILAAADGVI